MTLTLEQLIDEGLVRAREVYFDEPRNKFLMPEFRLERPAPDKPMLLFAPWNSEDEKYAMVEAAKEAASQYNAVAVMFLSESWMSQYSAAETAFTNETGLYDPPSQRPDRIEGIQVSATDGTRTLFKAWTIKRNVEGYVTDLISHDSEYTEFKVQILEGFLTHD